MAVTTSIKQRFEQHFECSLDSINRSIENIGQIAFPGKHHSDVGNGRGYVNFGKGVDAAVKDKATRQILKHW